MLEPLLTLLYRIDISLEVRLKFCWVPKKEFSSIFHESSLDDSVLEKKLPCIVLFFGELIYDLPLLYCFYCVTDTRF